MKTLLPFCMVILALSGCFTTRAELPGTLRADVTPQDVEKIGTLEIEKTNWFFLWGLVGQPPTDFFATDIQKAVQAKGADGVANLKYESQEGCVDWGVSGCTGYLVAPRTFKVTGDIVRIKKAPLPGKPAKVASSSSDPSSSSSDPSSLKTTEVVAAQQF
jgi:hypothetical protein